MRQRNSLLWFIAIVLILQLSLALGISIGGANPLEETIFYVGMIPAAVFAFILWAILPAQ